MSIVGQYSVALHSGTETVKSTKNLRELGGKLQKSLGSLMRSKVTEKEWKDVLSSRFWELKDEQTKTFAPFFLSYYDLSPRERRCFSYCSVFPKDFKFWKGHLIETWMSQGYLSGSQNPEEEGEKCFEILTKRSFFHDFRFGYNGRIVSCKMHDILHDFAQFLTRNECSVMRVQVDMEERERPGVEKVRHSWLSLAPNFPKIPISIFVKGCSRLQRLPEGMGKLVNLRQLYMRGCSALVGLPKGIGGLTQLQTLDTMVIPKKNEAAYFLSLGDLKRLNHLRFQTSFFEIRNCCNLINPSRSELMYWECLVNVFLDFGGIDKKEEIRDEEDEFGILEALQPHPSLRYLRIKQYKGTNLYPKWMMGLDRLTGLDFIDCKQCESLPPLGRLLPSLAVLRIDGLDKVKKIGDEFLGLGVEQVEAVSFPKLKWLFFYNMRDWEDWEGTAGTSLQPGVMPCLKVLEIENCGNLKSLPPYLKHTPLHILRINASGVLSQSLQNSEEEFTNISRITRIFVDGQELENNS
ncbi:putative disease resistance RPP13-like protein 1 isoform X3 [Ziziphus jujuba]|uniref:Disease resistance RPP13-like protein 1 isoform X3 n=1 Tax=Ziziphus jujuba TaxID=326968 RepID=A0ABM4AFF3_ZIZJJ|nr:putative disease resistance RPP13-like protein 1 isoform X3 [Ziziphus jujuba]XP_060676051.1 putative disease resistance RPP13-like protein 1 isoform X3 [Ziziphus jujuba]